MRLPLRNHLCLIVLVLAAACGGASEDATSTSESSNTETAAAETPAPTNETPAEAPTSAAALPENDACGLLTAEAVEKHVADAAGAEIQVVDDHQAIRYNDDSRSCAWRWDGHRIGLQVTGEPAGNRFDTWGSRMVATRIEDQGFAPVEDLGDSAAFSEDGSELFWRRGEGRIYSLSYAGPSPQARLDLATLRALAAEVGG